MSGDLIVYALVAAGLVFWLKSVLGTRHGDEKQRHNPYASNPENTTDMPLEGEAYEVSPASGEDKITELAEEPTDVLSVDNKTAEAGLVNIAKADRSFDIKAFLDGAQDAFVIIVESFGEGDRETLKNLLAEPVYNAFNHAITEREESEETLETEIHAIKKAEVIEAKLDGKMAFVTVRFTASETSVTRDKDGQILSGHPDKVADMRDIWVFGRSVRSRDPRWLVYETRGDFEGDNDMIPDSH